jgi:2-polyprenyl-3-methyl-5-hydroxy-6-metoxy-1,4-benzoquinol methylase
MISLVTSKPIATDSLDHKYPAGALGAGTSIRFIDKMKSMRDIENTLDIGCAGAGLVRDWLEHGVNAVGLDGTPHAAISANSRWPEINEKFGPGHVFTCDVIAPLELIEDKCIVKFDLITCYEMLEHIDEFDLYKVMANINKHAKPDTFLVITTSYDDSFSMGVNLHITKRDRVWWADFFTQHGWFESPRQSEMGTHDWMCSGDFTSQFLLEQRS